MKKYILLILFLPVYLWSCEGFLDQHARSQVDADKMFETDQGFKDALMACYVKLNSKTLYGESLTMTRIELMAQHWDLASTSGNFTTYIAFKNLDHTSDDSKSLFSSIFGAQYNVIVQANDVLKNLESKGHNIEFPQTKAVIEAEALTIRAFCHFEILRMFGQMPKNPQKKVSLPYAETVGNTAIPYYDYDAFMGLILRDLTAAEKIFEANDPLVKHTLLEMDNGVSLVDDPFLNYRRFRFNLYAVKALKARMYLYWGKNTDAYNSAKEVITATAESGEKMVSLAGEADLNANYFGLPTECVMALNNFQMKDSLFTVERYRLTKTHFEQMFAGRQTSSNNRLLKVWNSTASDAGGTVYPIIKKYTQPAAGETVTNIIRATRRQVIPLLRLSEMYLIVMETGTLAEANQLYPEYMLARNEFVTENLTQEELNDFIESEYRREFFAEGQMFYYYKRKGSSTMLWQSVNVPSFTEDNYVVPIPETELRKN